MARNIDTPEFKQWFGASKVVDQAGNPLPVYHGTSDEFKQFVSWAKRHTRGGAAFGQTDVHFFSGSAENASKYATEKRWMVGGTEQVKPCYLRIENPLVLDGTYFERGDTEPRFRNWRTYQKKVEDAWYSKRYDGVILKNIFDDVGYGSAGEQTTYVIFSANQAKSIYNKGTWSMESNNLSENLDRSRSAFTIFAESPGVLRTVSKFGKVPLSHLYKLSLQGNQDALTALVFKSIKPIVRGFQDALRGHPVYDQIKRSYEFLERFFNTINPKILQDFDARRYNPKDFQNGDEMFMQYMHDVSEEMAQEKHDQRELSGVKDEDLAKNQELQKSFLEYLKTHNPQYAKVFKNMVEGKSVQEILEIYAWKSPRSLANKIEVMKDLYQDFLAKSTTEKTSEVPSGE